MKTTAFTHILWDWNGTLVNDVYCALMAMNAVLSKRGLREIPNANTYRLLFNSNVREMYGQLGLDLENENFEDLAEEYVVNYRKMDWRDCHPFPEVVDVLMAFRNAGVKQTILTSSKTEDVVRISKYVGLFSYVDQIIGREDATAGDKTEMGRECIKGLDPGKVLLVGDTTGYYECSNVLGTACILIDKGYYSPSRLVNLPVPVLHEIKSLIPYVLIS